MAMKTDTIKSEFWCSNPDTPILSIVSPTHRNVEKMAKVGRQDFLAPICNKIHTFLKKQPLNFGEEIALHVGHAGQRKTGE